MSEQKRGLTRRMWSRAGSIAAMASLLLASAVLPAAAGTPAASSPASATRAMALGVSMLPYDDLSVLNQFARDTGHWPAIWSVWSDWGGSNAAFPTELLEGVRARHVVPMIIWQPVNPVIPAEADDPTYSYRTIIRGDHDAYLREWAEAAAAYGGRVILRLAHEHNGAWFPWSIGRLDNTAKRFILAWQHIWKIFRGPRGAGATNVRFLWSPNQPCDTCPSLASSYPGDAYVDFVGFSSFNWGAPQRFKTMKQTFRPSMVALAALTKKPVIAAETGSTPVGGSKARWIRDGYPEVFDLWPKLKAIVYFNVDSKTLANQQDWRLVTPTSALTAYREIVAQRRFRGRLQ